VRELDEADRYVRGYHFVMPFTQIRPAQIGQGDGPPETIISGHHWVPVDDETCIVWNWSYSFGENPLTERQRSQFGTGDGWDAVDRSRGFRSFANIDNDYNLDREIQRSKNFSGIQGINTQDRAVQESMGPIVDRSHEHLGPADRAIVTTRRLLLDATKQVAAGEDPLGARATSYFKARAIDKIFRRSDQWRDVLIPEMASL
jgi:phthalate 4,5-dioxygenase